MAIALSLDAFSVSLITGLIENNIKKYIVFSTIVGVFHFIMPSLGALTNHIFLENIIINANRLLGFILLIIAISMIIDNSKKENTISKAGIITLAFSVSIDSYFAGIGLKFLENFNIFIFIIFSIFSFTFSLLGCMLGRLGQKSFGKISNYLAIAILLMLSVKYILFN